MGAGGTGEMGARLAFLTAIQGAGFMDRLWGVT